MAENGGDFGSGQHAVALPQFAKAGPIAFLPAKDTADRPPIGQTGVVEKMAKEQLSIGHRTAVETIGAGAAGRPKGRGWRRFGRWTGRRPWPRPAQNWPIFATFLEELLKTLVGTINPDEKIAVGGGGQRMDVAHTVRMGLLGPAAVGALQAGWLEIGKKITRNMEIFTKENLA